MRLSRLTAVYLTFSITLIIYGLTLAPDLTWNYASSDGGELITAAVTGGVPHPPGYPTYIILGKLFSYFPAGTIAYRFNLFSAISTATAVSIIAATAWRLVNKNHWQTAVACALIAAFTPLIWSQATIAEVYGLNLLLVSAVIWSVVWQRPSTEKGLLLGLSITTHLTSLFLIPLVFLTTTRQQWKQLLTGLFLGLSPYLFIFLFAQSDSPVMWGEPATIKGWWWLISGELYRLNILSADWRARLPSWTILIAQQFSWIGLLFIIWGAGQSIIGGFWGNAEKVKRPSSTQTTNLLLVLTACFYIIYALTYHTSDAHVLLLPAILILSLLSATAVSTLKNFALLLPLLSLLLNFTTQQENLSQTIRPSAEQLLQSAPKNAIMITPGDGTIFTFWYLQHVEQQRSDLLLVDQTLFAYEWYRKRLAQQHPSSRWPDDYNLTELETLNEKRPFCQIALAEPNLDCRQQ